MEAAASLTQSPKWPKIQERLDTLPVFTVANEDGDPLQFQMGGQPVAMFYTDLAAAQEQLKSVKSQLAEDVSCDLAPFGLGGAYTLACQGKASIVPGVPELAAAGMPEGMSAVGQELPLYACMEMKRENDDGDTVLPLYMSVVDCEAAITKGREENPALSEMVPLSLPSVVEHLTALEEGAEDFEFIASSASKEHIASYVGNGIYWREVKDEEEKEAD